MSCVYRRHAPAGRRGGLRRIASLLVLRVATTSVRAQRSDEYNNIYILTAYIKFITSSRAAHQRIAGVQSMPTQSSASPSHFPTMMRRHRICGCSFDSTHRCSPCAAAAIPSRAAPRLGRRTRACATRAASGARRSSRAGGSAAAAQGSSRAARPTRSARAPARARTRHSWRTGAGASVDSRAP